MSDLMGDLLMDPEMFKVLSTINSELHDLIMGQLCTPIACDDAQLRRNMREIGERLIEASMTE